MSGCDLKLRRAIPALLIACTAGCNCNGDRVCTLLTSSTGSTSTTSTTGSVAGSAAGIWSGTDSATGLELNGFVTSGGQADFIRSDGVQFVGTAQTSGTTLNITLDGYTQYGYQFSDGSSFGSGTLSGTFTSGSAITASLQFSTASGSTLSSSWSLSFNSLYYTASALSTITGSYTDNLAAVSNGLDPLSGASVTISSSGVLYAQGSTDDCVLNGTVSVTDASADLYQVSYTYGNCSGDYALLNGIQFSGLAELNQTASPAVIVIAVTGTSTTGADYGIVSDLSAS